MGLGKIRQAKGKKKSDQSLYSLNEANEHNPQCHLEKMSFLEFFGGTRDGLGECFIEEKRCPEYPNQDPCCNCRGSYSRGVGYNSKCPQARETSVS